MTKIQGFIFRTTVAIISLLFIFQPAMPVLADDTETNTIDDVADPGILPDSAFYFLKNWGRNLQMLMATNNTQKAELALKFSDEDALAVKKLCENGKCDQAAKHTEQYQEQFQNAIKYMEQAEFQESTDITGLITKLEQNYLRQQAVLASVLVKVPEPAQKGILNAIENSNKHVEKFIAENKGQTALAQYQEQINQQIINMGEDTKLKIQQRLRASHGRQNAQSSQNSQPADSTVSEQQETEEEATLQLTTQPAQNTQNPSNDENQDKSDTNNKGNDNKQHGK